jgi:hypothetical protein
MRIAETRQAVMRFNFNLEAFNLDRREAENPPAATSALRTKQRETLNQGRLNLINSDIFFNPEQRRVFKLV